MSQPSRRLPTEERRRQLLELGLQLFSQRSYEDVEIAEIAEIAGVSKGLLYHYFGSKKDFYAAVIAVAAKRLTDAIQPAPELSGLARARAGVEAYLDFVEERAEAFLAVMFGGIGSDPSVLAIVEETRQAIIDQMMAGIGIADPSPFFRVAARAWLGAMEAASLDWLRHRDLTRDQMLQLALVSLGTHITVAMRAETELEPDPTMQAFLRSLLLPASPK